MQILITWHRGDISDNVYDDDIHIHIYMYIQYKQHIHKYIHLHILYINDICIDHESLQTFLHPFPSMPGGDQRLQSDLM